VSPFLHTSIKEPLNCALTHSQAVCTDKLVQMTAGTKFHFCSTAIFVSIFCWFEGNILFEVTSAVKSYKLFIIR